ncbi:MAG: FG-GAP-like repeat-containing protein, partial [Patescibacteria group bacterium]
MNIKTTTLFFSIFFCLLIVFPLATFSQEEYSLSLFEEFTGEAAGDNAGYDLAFGDINDDGYEDILICSVVTSNSGAVYLIYGQADKLESASLSTAIKFTAENEWDIISDVSSGDVNGDGYDDILTVSNYNDENGAVYLIYGRADKFTSASLSTAIKFTGEEAWDEPMTVSADGDYNSDGYRDILVTSFSNSDGGAAAGAAYLIYGQAEDLTGGSLSTAVEFTGEAANDAAGFASSAGDVNGDSYDDFLVGAYNNNDGGAAAGAAYLIYGQAEDLTGGSLSTAVEFTGEAAGDLAGYYVSPAGDVNGDSYDDFLVGAPRNDSDGNNAGTAYLIYGRSAQLTSVSLSTAVKFTGEVADDTAFAVCPARDINNDGYDDFFVGTWKNDDGGINAGAMYLIYGKSANYSNTSLSTVVQFKGVVADDRAGTAAVAGDVNNDGYNEVIINAGNSASGAGSAYLGYLYIDNDGDGMAGDAGLFAGADPNDNDFDNDGSETGTDCNDDDATVQTNQTYYYDNDNDGKGNPLNTTSVCSATAPSGYVTDNTDINDDITTSTISNQSWNEDNTTTINLSTYFTQRESLSFTYTVVSTDTPDNITISIDGSTATLTPEANWYGTDTVTFKATDSNG